MTAYLMPAVAQLQDDGIEVAPMEVALHTPHSFEPGMSVHVDFVEGVQNHVPVDALVSHGEGAGEILVGANEAREGLWLIVDVAEVFGIRGEEAAR